MAQRVLLRVATTVPQNTRHQTLDIDLLLDQCWASVVDDGPTLIQHWVDVLCLWGIVYRSTGTKTTPFCLNFEV